ncbi:unnamed protein product [Ranitomeya imitator]|uniref:Solute carrier family 41 member n=1 Tax=Ranitomeya imitator TaxID=111125 RepID=A0ABN9MJ20_9NEOB|nr:unnamed protein product [Ranitomeya imitator]
MVPLMCHKGQEERLKKINGLSPSGHGFNLRADQHLEYHHFSEPSYLGNAPHCSNICSTSYDYDSYDYCEGRDASESDTMLQDGRNPGDGDTDALLDGSKKQPKESSFTMALQILVPFLLAGFGTVSAGMVLDIVQHWEVFKNLTEVFILVPALLGLKGNLEMTLASRLSTAVNVGKMDSPIEKWNLIIGNLALKQVQATVVGFLAAVAAVILGWIPEGKYRLDHAILLCSSSIIMVGVIVGSKKTGINPDNVATPIAASFGDLITLAILAWISQGLYSCIATLLPFWQYALDHCPFGRPISIQDFKFPDDVLRCCFSVAKPSHDATKRTSVFQVYINIHSQAMFPNSENRFFQQDNAPCHTARSIKVWMKDHHIKTLSWAAQSPDLNTIENLWNVIKRKMDSHKPSNKEQLLTFLYPDWHKLTTFTSGKLEGKPPWIHGSHCKKIFSLAE